MSNDSRYGINRNLWRRVYGYTGTKPNTVVITDPVNFTTHSLDINNVYRHRDYFLIKGLVSGSNGRSIPTAEYDEGILEFTLADSYFKTGSFNFTFSGSPIIVLTVEEDNGTHTNNINPYGISFTNSQFVAGVSAPFSGALRYRAIYSNMYRANASSSYTASILASAGIVDVTSSYQYFTNFGLVPSPFKFLQTPWDINNNHDNDVYLDLVDLNNVEVSASISAPITNRIHFIVYG